MILINLGATRLIIAYNLLKFVNPVIINPISHFIYRIYASIEFLYPLFLIIGGVMFLCLGICIIVKGGKLGIRGIVFGIIWVILGSIIIINSFMTVYPLI